MSLQGRNCTVFVYSLDDDVYLASWDAGVLLRLLLISKDFMLFSVELEGGTLSFPILH